MQQVYDKARVESAEELPLTRVELLDAGRRVMEDAFSKLNRVSLREGDRQSYMRIIVNVISGVSPLLRDTELDRLKSDVEELKSLVSALKH